MVAIAIVAAELNLVAHEIGRLNSELTQLRYGQEELEGRESPTPQPTATPQPTPTLPPSPTPQPTPTPVRLLPAPTPLADRDAAANCYPAADPVTCDCAAATTDGHSAAQAHATTDSDSNHISANRHASANGHSATRAHAAAHTDSPADTDPGRPGLATYTNAVSNLE